MRRLLICLIRHTDRATVVRQQMLRHAISPLLSLLDAAFYAMLDLAATRLFFVFA